MERDNIVNRTSISHLHNALIYCYSTGSKWKTRRRLLTPSFHFDILKEFLGIMNRHARKFVVNLQQFATSRPTTFDIYPLITNSTLDVICGSYNDI